MRHNTKDAMYCVFTLAVIKTELGNIYQGKRIKRFKTLHASNYCFYVDTIAKRYICRTKVDTQAVTLACFCCRFTVFNLMF